MQRWCLDRSERARRAHRADQQSHTGDQLRITDDLANDGPGSRDVTARQCEMRTGHENNPSRHQQRPPAPVLLGNQQRYQEHDIRPVVGDRQRRCEQGRQRDHGGRSDMHSRLCESATREHSSGDDRGDTKQPQDVLKDTGSAQSGD
jgi:hypothetical protein